MCAARMALRTQTARPCRPTGLEPPNHRFSGNSFSANP